MTLSRSDIGHAVDSIPLVASMDTLTVLETLLDNAPIGFGFVDRDFRLMRLNQTLAAINASTVADQVGRAVGDAIPQLWSQLGPVWRRVFSTGKAIMNVQAEVLAADGSSTGRSWSTSSYPVVLEHEVVGIGLIVVDTTDHRAGEAGAPASGSAPRRLRRRHVGLDQRWNDHCVERSRGAAVRLHGRRNHRTACILDRAARASG